MIDCSIPCTGDVCAGDIIRFVEAVFCGSHRKPQFLGDREIIARVIADSYGAAKQQHTFSLEVIASSGCQALAAGIRTTRKGRNVYRNGTWRALWDDEAARKAVLAEKHHRGDFARAARTERKEHAAV